MQVDKRTSGAQPRDRGRGSSLPSEAQRFPGRSRGGVPLSSLLEALSFLFGGPSFSYSLSPARTVTVPTGRCQPAGQMFIANGCLPSLSGRTRLTLSLMCVLVSSSCFA